MPYIHAYTRLHTYLKYLHTQLHTQKSNYKLPGTKHTPNRHLITLQLKNLRTQLHTKQYKQLETDLQRNRLT